MSTEKDIYKHKKCYGSVTVGERGQVVIPAEVRNDLGIKPGDKLIVFLGLKMSGVTFVKAEVVTEFVAKAMEHLSEVKEVIEGEK